MGTNDQPFPDVAFIALKDMEDTETNIYYPDDYRNRYAISQVVDEKNHKNIIRMKKKNLWVWCLNTEMTLDKIN